MTFDPEFLDAPQRPAVRIARLYDHPIERVWKAVTEPANLVQWFPSEVEFDLRPGGSVRYSEGDWSSEGHVLEIDPPRLLTFTWEEDRLQFELFPERSGTRFVLTHWFADRAGAASYATGWEACINALTSLVDGEAPPPDERRVQRHEELAERFKLSEPAVFRTEAGWRVRWERQLTATAETVWNIFFGVDSSTGEQRIAPAVGEEFRPFGAPNVVLGTVTEVDHPHRFAFDTAPGEPGDHLWFELGPGTGHGARLILEVTGTNEDELESAIDQWGHGAISHLAQEAAIRGA